MAHELIGFNAAGEQVEPAPWIHKYRYGPWEIDLYPMGTHNEWQWCHKDYDGAPDANDNRYGFAPSLTAAQDACDDWEAGL